MVQKVEVVGRRDEVLDCLYCVFVNLLCARMRWSRT